MLTIDLPRSLAPHYTNDGNAIRSSIDWQSAGGGKGRGKTAAKAHARSHGFAVVLWKSGNTTVYATTRDDDLARVRYTN